MCLNPSSLLCHQAKIPQLPLLIVSSRSHQMELVSPSGPRHHWLSFIIGFKQLVKSSERLHFNRLTGCLVRWRKWSCLSMQIDATFTSCSLADAVMAWLIISDLSCGLKSSHKCKKCVPISQDDYLSSVSITSLNL